MYRILKISFLFIFYISGDIIKIDKYILKYSSDFFPNKEEEKKALKEGRIFFKKCTDDSLISQHNFTKNTNPLVSVVIPIYNSQNTIKKTIKSIQNQNISNLEMILVNDYSTDNTIDIIKCLQKEDERIILLENKRNRGIFYTRCIGTLKSSGNYIFPLDNDDLFFDEDVINSILNQAINGNYDIVEFNYAEFYDMNSPPKKLISSEFGNHSHNLVLYQPELSQFPRNKNNVYGVYDCYIWAKCIQTKLYKESINKIGKKIYSKRILRGEDFIITFVLFRLANSFKYYGKYGIFRYKNHGTATYKSSRELYLLSRIIYLDVILKFTDNNITDKLYVVNFASWFLKTMSKELDIISNRNQIYFKKVFNKLIYNRYIRTKHKKAFINIFRGFDWLFNYE